MKHCLKRSFYFSFLLFFLGLSNWDKVYAAEPCTWIETTENVAKLGLEKIWFAPDLNKAVFLRSGKLQNKKPDFNASAVKQLDNKMAHT